MYLDVKKSIIDRIGLINLVIVSFKNEVNKVCSNGQIQCKTLPGAKGDQGAT